MARARSPDRDKAFEMWKASDGRMLLKDIAADLSLSDSQIRKWKNIDKWEERLNGNVTNESKSNVTIEKKKGAPKGNQNAVGNNGGAPLGNKNAVGNHGGAPSGNSNAVTHGFFRKYFPDDEETQELLSDADILSPVDMLWINIKTQFMAIIRSQKIMFVQDHDDETRIVRKTKESAMSSETEWEIQHSWDKYATYLNAQARAMSELRSSVKDFLLMSGKDDKRRLELEQMRQTVERNQLEIEKLKDDSGDKPIEIIIKRKGEGP